MIKISGDIALCLHPDRCTEIVTVARQAGPAYQRTTLSPVKGMLRRVVRGGPAFYRAVCPDCGSWGASLYWLPVIAPALVSTADGGYAAPRTPGEKELT